MIYEGEYDMKTTHEPESWLIMCCVPKLVALGLIQIEWIVIRVSSLTNMIYVGD